MERRNIIVAILSITLTIIVLIGSSYAYLRQARKGTNQNITIANFGLVISKDMEAITLNNDVPKKDEEGLKNSPSTFKIKNEGDIEAKFKLSLIDDELLKSTMSNNNIRYKLKRTRSTTGESEEFEIRTLRSDGVIDEGLIDREEEISYEIIIWIDYDANPNDLSFRKVLSLEGSQIDIKNTLYTKITDVIKEHQGTTIEEDGVTYLSGSNDDVNYNYVWYSGKLWRITSINSDGTIKMITQDEITTLIWGANAIYKDSWIRQWLNEDFKDTLYNYQNIIVQNADWNVTEDGNSPPVKPPTDASATIIQGDVGSLTSYEYYQSYKNLALNNNGYLVNGYYWWLMTPCSNSEVQGVSNLGVIYNSSPSLAAVGVRPSVNLKSNIEVSGEGTKNNPYTIMLDKPIGNPMELINTRLSGEYVRVDNKVYRIVGIENSATKLTGIDYVRDEGNTIITKNFGSNNNWATSVASENNNYWGYYLNNTWLTPELQKYITEGTYYLGQVGNLSYKNSICSESNTTETTKSCIKTKSVWTGYVGLPRVGEMFSSQIGEGYSTSSHIWLITPYVDSTVRYLHDLGRFTNDSPSTRACGTRPSIFLKSEIIISGGSGTQEDPYEVALPE